MAQPQQFSISLNGTVYNLRITYCPPAGYWVMDISDASGNPLVNGVPLVTGGLLLKQFGYLGFTGDMVVISSPDADTIPDFNGLGSTGQLYFWPRFA